MGSACGPNTTRRTPIFGCVVTSNKCSRNGRPWKSNSAFGKPIRLEAPPERITAASMESSLYRFLNDAVRIQLQLLVGCWLRVPAHGHEFRHNAERDLFRGERTDLQSHRGEYALELLHSITLFFQGLVHAQH